MYKSVNKPKPVKSTVRLNSTKKSGLCIVNNNTLVPMLNPSKLKIAPLPSFSQRVQIDINKAQTKIRSAITRIKNIMEPRKND